MQQEPDFDQVAESLRSNDMKTRSQAAKKLSAFIDHRSVSVLMQAFLNPSNSAIRNDISNALVQLNKLSAPPPSYLYLVKIMKIYTSGLYGP